MRISKGRSCNEATTTPQILWNPIMTINDWVRDIWACLICLSMQTYVVTSFHNMWRIIVNDSAGKNLSDSNTQICPVRKNRVWAKIFRTNFKSEHYIFHISIVRTRFWPELSLVRIVRSEKIVYRSLISCSNFDIVWFVRSKFDPNPNYCRC